MLQTWSNILTTANSHPNYRICATVSNKGLRYYEIKDINKSKTFFNTYFNWFPKSPRQLSLREIVSHSKYQVANSEDEISQMSIHRINALIKFISNGKVNKNFKDQVIIQLQEIEFYYPLKTICDELEIMSWRASSKRADKIIKNRHWIIIIWSIIQEAIYSLIYNQNSRIEELRHSISKKFNPNMNEVLEKVKSTLRTRTLAKMVFFETIIDADEDTDLELLEDTEIKIFQSPSQIRNLWLAKYDEEHQHCEYPKKAQKIQNEIRILLDVWDHCIEDSIAHK